MNEYTSGKAFSDSGNVRYLKSSIDRQVYARRCLGCGNADKIYQKSYHNGGCPVQNPESGSKLAIYSGPFNALVKVEGGFTMWKDADARCWELDPEDNKSLKIDYDREPADA